MIGMASEGVIGPVFLRDSNGILISLPAVGLITLQEITAVSKKRGRFREGGKTDLGEGDGRRR